MISKNEKCTVIIHLSGIICMFFLRFPVTTLAPICNFKNNCTYSSIRMYKASKTYFIVRIILLEQFEGKI